MSGRSGDDEPTFADRVEGVTPLAKRATVAPPAPPRARARRDPGTAATAPPFVRPFEDEPLLGRAPGVTERTLGRLRAGEPVPDARIDLHGLDRQAARAHLVRRVAEVCSQGARCVLVVHGRGLRSGSGEPVLRSALPGWLDAAPLRHQVLAFSPARAGDGGEGATYLLLARL